MTTNLEAVLGDLHQIKKRINEPNWRLVKEGVETLIKRLEQEQIDIQELYGNQTNR